MFFFECFGHNEHDLKSKFDFVLKEDPLFKKSHPHHSDNIANISISLFSNEYHRGSTLKCNREELFNFARSFFHFLSRAAKNNTISTTIGKYDDSNYGALRQSISNFFLHIRQTLEDIYDTINEDGISDYAAILSDIKKSIYDFRLMLKSIDTLPDYVIRNCTSDFGNQCTLASFHLFHLYLELHWLHLTIVLKLCIIEQVFAQETLIDTEEGFNFDLQVNVGKNYNSEIETEIKWLLYNLVSMGNKCYEKMGPKRIFSCSCVKGLWMALQILVDNLAKENKCDDFWSYFNYILNNHVFKSSSPSKDLIVQCNTLYVMKKIDCRNQLEFGLWLLLYVTQLQGYSDDGEYIGITSQRITPNYALLEMMLKQITSNEQNVPEINFREHMYHVVKILTVWWEPKSEVVTLLWEYFHKRLNSAFAIPGKDDSVVCLLSSSVPDIVNNLKSRFSLDNTLKRDTKGESSFSLFITLLGVHLKKSILANQQSNCQRIKGRILPKFTINKILALNEYGLQNFSTIFTVMAVTSDLTDICSKLQNLIGQLVFDTLPFKKKQIVVKTHLVIMYLYIDNGVSISESAKPIIAILSKYCSLRDSESMALMRIIVSGVEDIIDLSANFEYSQHILIDNWIGKYLNTCSLPELSNTLGCFSSLLSKLRILCTYHDNSSEGVSLMVDSFFLHIFTTVKILYGNGATALQIAELAFSFVKFVYENKSCAAKYGSFEDVLKFFTFSEAANERITRHFLLQILQDEQLLHSFSNERKSSETFIIHCWIKCALLSSETATDDDTHLMLLVCQLSQFASLNITPSYSGEQGNLCRFFYAIGVAWNNTKGLQERCSFRERINQYLNQIDKYVITALKCPSSQESVTQLFIVLGTLFLHCSQIIYSRAKPTCLLHTLVGNVLLPPQVFMEKKLHPYIISGICKSWYMFMKGLHQLDHKNDVYIAVTMKDMVVQYLPYFANKTLSTKNNIYEISHRMIHFKYNSDLLLEEYILEKISTYFITCHGKQCHAHAPKALAVIHNLISSTENLKLLQIIVTCTSKSIFEQIMFSDTTSPNKKIAYQIVDAICDYAHFKNKLDNSSIQSIIKTALLTTCEQYLAFNSAAFFKLIVTLPTALAAIISEFLPCLESDIRNVERKRGVGYDHGLRNGLNEVKAHHSKIISTQQP